MKLKSPWTKDPYFDNPTTETVPYFIILLLQLKKPPQYKSLEVELISEGLSWYKCACVCVRAHAGHTVNFLIL